MVSPSPCPCGRAWGRQVLSSHGWATETPSGTRLAAGSEQASGGGYRGGTLPPAGFGKASADDGQVGDDDSG